MRFRLRRVAAIVAAGAIGGLAMLTAPSGAFAAPAPATPPADLPWSLRDHYEVTAGNATVIYSAENAEWAVRVEGLGLVIDHAGFRITFADGRTLGTADLLEKAESNRNTFSNEAGDGTDFWCEFRPQNGLVLRHTLTVHKQRPFLLIRLALKNVGDAPIEVSEVCPVVIGPGGIAHLSADTAVKRRRVVFRGGHPVFSRDAPSALTVFNDRAHDLSLSLGFLPLGIADTRIDLDSYEGAWQGDIVCAYTPSVRIDPGEEIETDRVWLSAAIRKPARIDMFYSWAQGLRPKPTVDTAIPSWWVAVPDGEPQSALLDAAKKWSGTRALAALVPPAWEGRPGSMEGARPAYPKEMAKVAGSLRSVGAQPGITVDPLLTDRGSPGWTAKSSDGRTWLNLSVSDARGLAIERMQAARDWGFEFFVIQPSGIPDEVLHHFNMTRRQAGTLAFRVTAEAAAGRPVLPSAAATLPADLDHWLEAAASSSRMAGQGITPGPVRFNVAGPDALDENLALAMTFFCGAVEFVGTPKPHVQEQIARQLSLFRLPAYPLDAAKRSPRLWQVRIRPAEEACYGEAVVMFPEAPSWGLSDLTLETDKPVLVWRTTDGQTVDVSQDKVSASSGLTIYGVRPARPRPMLLGASGSPTCLLDDVKGLKWDAEEQLLSGGFRGHNHEPATAYVHIPQGWALKSGEVGGVRVRAKKAENPLAFQVAPGRATLFEFTFERTGSP